MMKARVGVCFPVNLGKFLGTPFLKNTSGGYPCFAHFDT